MSPKYGSLSLTSSLYFEDGSEPVRKPLVGPWPGFERIQPPGAAVAAVAAAAAAAAAAPYD